jgi:hypothetical protein
MSWNSGESVDGASSFVVSLTLANMKLMEGMVVALWISFCFSVLVYIDFDFSRLVPQWVGRTSSEKRGKAFHDGINNGLVALDPQVDVAFLHHGETSHDILCQWEVWWECRHHNIDMLMGLCCDLQRFKVLVGNVQAWMVEQEAVKEVDAHVHTT